MTPLDFSPRSSPRSVRAIAAIASAGVLVASIVGACSGPSPHPVGPQPSSSAAAQGSANPTTSASAKPYDPCDGSAPLSRPYFGVLADARCEEDKYPIMSDVVFMLGVDCKYCHVPDPDNPKKEIYPPMTPRKHIANWMKASLMKAIKPADGSQMRCKSCHVDDQGKPLAKILGQPRDPLKAHEWMSLVMTKKFVVAATGEKLKCKHCHVGNYSTAEWQAKVILTDHIPLPPTPTPAPSPSPDPTATSAPTGNVPGN